MKKTSEYAINIDLTQLTQAELIAFINERDTFFLNETFSLEQQLKLLKQRHFGRKSEAYVHPSQGSLFEGMPEVDVPVTDDTSVKSTVTQCSSKASGSITLPRGRKALPEHLPRERIVLDTDDKQCKVCQSELQVMKTEVSEKLNYIPATFNVIRTERIIRRCRCCEMLVSPAVPGEIIDKGIPTAELLTEVIANKFIYHMPLYRQVQQFSNMGMTLPLSTLSDWVSAVGDAFTPLAKCLKELLLKQSVIHADEPRLTLLESHLDKNSIQGYVWAYVSSEHAYEKVIYYECQKSRSSKHPNDFFLDYYGTVLVDDYIGYKSLFAKEPHMLYEMGCMAHVRRKFIEADKLGKNPYAEHVIQEIGKLYHLESQLKHLSPRRRKKIRLKKAKPILIKLKLWLETLLTKLLPSNSLAKAIAHVLKRWPALQKYLGACQDCVSLLLVVSVI